MSQIIRWRESACPALQPFIAGYWGWESQGAVSMPSLIPGTGCECLFHLAAPLCDWLGHPLPDTHLVCPRERTQTLAPPQPISFIAVRFRAGQLRHFTACSFAEVADQLVEGAVLWPGDTTRLQDALRTAPDRQAYIARLEAFLLTQLARHFRTAEQRQDRLIDHLYYSPNRRIAELAQDWGWSQRHLERRFLQAFGQTPKRFARLARLHQTLRQQSQEIDRHWLDIALERGFSDQSHFIHDIQDITGWSPARWREALRQGQHYYLPASRQPVR